MTVTTRDFENTQFADGVALTFSYTFRSLLPEFVIVVNITDGYTYSYGSEYTVDEDGSGVGGTITLSTAPPDDGDEIHIYRLIQPFQLVHLIDEQELDAETFEFVFDKLTFLIQGLERDFRFLADVTIPGLEDLIASILDLSGTTLGPGTSRIEGGIPVWTGATAATLSTGLVGTAPDDILKWDGTQWVASQGVPVLNLGDIIAPGATDENGLVVWTDDTGTSIGTIPAGEDGEVLAGVTGDAPAFKPVLEVLGDLTSTAGHVLTSQGTGSDAVFAPIPAAPINTAAFFTATSRPRGLKYWSLSSPLGYAVGGNRAKTTGSDSNVAGARGLYYVLTTTTTLASYVQAYTVKADAITQRNALPIFLTRILTGAAVTNQRTWVGLNKDDLVNMRNSSTPTKSTAAFRFDPAVDGTTWHSVTCTSGGVTTVNDTGVVYDEETEYDMAVDMSEPGHVKFWIDGIEVEDHSTNLPDATDLLDWLITLKNTAAGVAHSIGIGPINLSHA